ncbi:MAG: ABC transporter substrate-binding protein, partial [Methyloceanibacter sp.]|nr:ABC transporter substrate-binding protein [Methyloceanibacter sp.]
QEASAKNWATAYDFSAVRDGFIKRQEVAIKRTQPMQCFVLNLRRSQFADRRVRQAFNLAFDFEWNNKNLFYGQYARVGSYFQNSELAAPAELPQGRELEILNEVKDGVPPEVFTDVHRNPVNNTPDDMRSNLRKAVELLKAAGWEIKDGALTNVKTGQQMKVEFLLVSPLFERIVQPYLRNLEKLGIKGTIRMVDSAQYAQRLNVFDYDVVVANFAQSDSPGNEQRDFWGTEAAGREGSQNLIGLKDPAIDRLVDHVIFAKDRAELIAATHALDRVLQWNELVVPQWFSPNVRIAYWNRYGQPKVLPGLTPAFLQVWWFDQTLADRLPGPSKL